MTPARTLVFVPEDRLAALEELAELAADLACYVANRPCPIDDPELFAERIIELSDQVYRAERPSERETGA